MNQKKEKESDTEASVLSRSIEADLDRRTYHLKTLYDVSRDIFSSVDVDVILKNFLLMTMGNFGVMEGFVVMVEVESREISHFECMGFQEPFQTTLREEAKDILLKGLEEDVGKNGRILTDEQFLPQNVACVLSFPVSHRFSGLLGLGSKLVGDSYTEDDRELLLTLVNNLSVALKNARSFENIKRLNLDLQEKNVQLEKTLEKLKAALKKVELLESIKANLSKFVPSTVSRIIEESPQADSLDAKERDVSVLFLDIEEYTKITERVGPTEVSRLIEKYFSVFMDAIYSNNGDVNETAGDGLMVLFLSDDATTNAQEAVRTALMIREKTDLINQANRASSESLLINMGISSGLAHVGAAKFESITGSRWTYTSHGMTTNVAARICSQASKGAILVSEATAERVRNQFSFKPMGKFALKNLSDKVGIFGL